MKKKIKVISLFAGCGGFDLGFKKAGYEIVYANDNDPKVRETYEKNIKHKIIIEDIRLIDKKTIPPGDIILAGIPCQPFSSAGNRKSTKDKDGNLFLEVIETIKHQKKKPKVIVFENVRGFLSSKDNKGIPLTQRFSKEMKKVGYNTKFQLLNAADYGVASNRYRVFLICIIENIKKNYNFPPPYILFNKITVGEIINKSYPKGEKQEVWNLSPETMKYIKYIKEGGSWKDIPYNKLSNAHKKIKDNIKRYRSPNFYRRFGRDEVMGTITAASTPENSGIIHPIENRRYSVREIARFQSFPDNFKFYGTSIPSKYKMIGNAVPPKLSFEIAKSLFNLF